MTWQCLYVAHYPANISQIPENLENFEGDELELVKQIRMVYPDSHLWADLFRAAGMLAISKAELATFEEKVIMCKAEAETLVKCLCRVPPKRRAGPCHSPQADRARRSHGREQGNSG